MLFRSVDAPLHPSLAAKNGPNDFYPLPHLMRRTTAPALPERDAPLAHRLPVYEEQLLALEQIAEGIDSTLQEWLLYADAASGGAKEGDVDYQVRQLNLSDDTARVIQFRESILREPLRSHWPESALAADSMTVARHGLRQARRMFREGHESLDLARLRKFVRARILEQVQP